MDRTLANGRFVEADALFKAGAYDEALAVLDELYAIFPNEHRLLRARVETLAKLGRIDEALALCERLLEEFEYEKVRPLRERLLRQETAAAVPFVAHTDRSLDDLEHCFNIHGLWHIENGQEIEDEGLKYGGPNRFKLFVGLPQNESAFQFVYYTETFGSFAVPKKLEASKAAV